jgi:hypothetical protein
MDVLADYDLFQLEHRVKPDYCNAGGLNVYTGDIINDGDDGWEGWRDPETGEDDPRAWIEEQLSKH